jgi:eukaryotic-like serine/threonine-protein kinase
MASPRSRATRIPVQPRTESRVPAAEHQARLRILLYVAFGSFAAVGFLAALAPLFSPPATPVTLGLQFLSLAVCLIAAGLVLILARPRPAHTVQVLNHGFAVMVSLAMAIAEVALAPELGHGRWGVSGIGIWIVLVPLLSPASPRATLAVALACASAVPLVYLAGRVLGQPAQSGPSLFAWIFPLYFCAGLAVVAATSLHRYRQALAAARRALHELGQYQLIRLLGQGGMGEVWLARHRLLQRSAAIKFIVPAQSTAGTRRLALTAQFEAEASAIARLSSVHTVTLYDYGLSEEGEWYYVMELLDGIDLQAAVERWGPMPDWRVVRLLAQTCRSLAEAHAQGLVHRDIKPGNLMLCRIGDEVDMVKVVDFGLVGLGAGTVGEVGPEGASGWVGSTGYVAPEVLLGTGPGDARVDLYALGCVAWYLLTGQTVYPEASSVQEECVLHCTQAPSGVLAATGADPGLVTLILALLAKRPDERPATATIVRQRLLGLPCAGGFSDELVLPWWNRIQSPVVVDAEVN